MKSLPVRISIRKYIGLPVLLLTMILVFSCSDRDSQNLTFAQLSTEEQETIVNRVDSLLIDRYVFPDIGKEGGAFIKSQFVSGAYEKVTDIQKFARSLSDDLYSIAKDRHLRIRVNPPERTRQEREDPRIAAIKRNRRQYRENFGFEKVEILEGNVGYVDFHYFAPAELMRDAASSAMRFLQNTDAIIFDMRNNGGGSPEGVQYVCSYFFDKPTHLNSLYWRRGDRTQEFWTLDEVDGKKRPDVPVFILTSQRTFSGAEEFCYNFQTRKRATLIGETTGGGANPGGGVPVNDQLFIFIPTGRAINPVTGINWEGTGVEPDIKVDREKALKVALKEAKIAAEEYREKESALMGNLTQEFDQAETLFSEKKKKEAVEILNSTLKTALHHQFIDELLVNNLGYEYLGKNDYAMAIAVFQFNVKEFPKSSNVWDSLGEAYMNSGNNKLAIKNYKKSLELDPYNEGAKEMLAKMGVKVK